MLTQVSIGIPTLSALRVTFKKKNRARFRRPCPKLHTN